MHARLSPIERTVKIENNEVIEHNDLSAPPPRTDTHTHRQKKNIDGEETVNMYNKYDVKTRVVW